MYHWKNFTARFLAWELLNTFAKTKKKLVRNRLVCSRNYLDSIFGNFPYLGYIKFVYRWFGEPIIRRLLRSSKSSVPVDPMATSYSTLVLPDGAKLAYEVLGSYHLERRKPIVLICGMSSTRVDFERLTKCLIRSHPGLAP